MFSSSLSSSKELLLDEKHSLSNISQTSTCEVHCASEIDFTEYKKNVKMLRFIAQFLHRLKHKSPLIYIPNRPFNSFPPNSNLNHAFEEMSRKGLDMKFKDYDTMLNECVNQKSLRGGQRVQAHMIKTHYHPPVYLRTRLIVLFLKCEVLCDARMVFDEMPERNVVSWSAMISGYARSGFHTEALDLFVRMLKSGTDPNEFTFATVLTSCTGAFELEYGRQIHAIIAKSPSFRTNIYVGSSLLDLYAKAGRINEARSIFEGLPQRDTVSCTSIISAYAQLGLDKDALDLFRNLYKEGMVLNYVTYASILTALSGLAALEYGRQVHSHVLRSEQPFYVVLQNSLIDMYSKCGNLSYARRIFDKMPERTVVSWNAMLMGYSKHGIGREIVNLYYMMREENKIKPDKTTLLIVLSGCSHGGLEKKGLELFNEIVNGNYVFDLGVEHYGCVVDLLGRSGQVKRALNFIQNMPFTANAAIWGSLLGACTVHKNVEIGKIAGDRLLEMEPENGRNYAILCNLYASEGKWEEVRSLRERMKGKIIKEPGMSWIEINQTLHTFYASERFHPRREEVFDKVRELSDGVKQVGYVPDLGSVLHDVDEEQKEKILLGHSEKLALAFGMMNVCESKVIRVMKNLRICVDCHNFAKLVSRVYGREIVIRDKSRFHCMEEGTCSCGDYW